MPTTVVCPMYITSMNEKFGYAPGTSVMIPAAVVVVVVGAGTMARAGAFRLFID